VRANLLDDAVDGFPESRHLAALEPGFAVHAKLESINPGEHFQEPGQGGAGVGDEVPGGQVPHEALSGPARMVRRPLNTAAIDVVPDAEGEVEAVVVGLADHPLEGLDVAALPTTRTSGNSGRSKK